MFVVLRFDFLRTLKMRFIGTLAAVLSLSTLVISLNTSEALPVVDLGYELHRASGFIVSTINLVLKQCH